MLEYTFNYTARNGYVIVKLTGSIRSDDALDSFTEIITQLSDKVLLKKINVVFDFTGLKLINSSGIGKMLVFNKFLLEKECNLYLTGVSPALRQLFKFARIDQLLKLYNSLDDIS